MSRTVAVKFWPTNVCPNDSPAATRVQRTTDAEGRNNGVARMAGAPKPRLPNGDRPTDYKYSLRITAPARQFHVAPDLSPHAEITSSPFSHCGARLGELAWSLLHVVQQASL